MESKCDFRTANRGKAHAEHNQWEGIDRGNDRSPRTDDEQGWEGGREGGREGETEG